MEELRRRVAKVNWFHTIDLGDGIVTPGGTTRRASSAWLPSPRDLRGRTVLDVGAWDGFFSFEAERRGAERVVAIDALLGRPAGRADRDAPGSTSRGARSARGSRTASSTYSTVARDGRHFDVVLFLGVLYHIAPVARARAGRERRRGNC